MVLAIAGLAIVIWAAPARGDGLPIPGVTVSPGGVTAPGTMTHFLTRQAAARRTIVRGVDWSSRRTTGKLAIVGPYTVPAVALDVSPDGLSADGRTLALIKPRLTFPQSHTRLVLLSTQPLRVERRLNLQGDFSFDAISPDGSRLYLIRYLSPRDPTRYAVRSLDTRTGALIPGAIVDPNEQNPDEMRGYPITRATSPDGSWAYTLYSGSKKPFVHALDTANGSAHCIDLPKLGGGSIYSDHLRMSPDGTSVSILGRKGIALAVIDTSTLEASAPTAAPSPENAGDRAPAGGGAPWELIALAAVLGACGLALMQRRRRAMAAA